MEKIKSLETVNEPAALIAQAMVWCNEGLTVFESIHRYRTAYLVGLQRVFGNGAIYSQMVHLKHLLMSQVPVIPRSFPWHILDVTSSLFLPLKGNTASKLLRSAFCLTETAVKSLNAGETYIYLIGQKGGRMFAKHAMNRDKVLCVTS